MKTSPKAPTGARPPRRTQKPTSVGGSRFRDPVGRPDHRKYGNLPVLLRARIAYEAFMSPRSKEWHGVPSWGTPPRWFIRTLSLRPGQLVRKGLVSLYMRLSWILYRINGTIVRHVGRRLRTALGYTVNALRHHLCSPYAHTFRGMWGLALAYRPGSDRVETSVSDWPRGARRPKSRHHSRCMSARAQPCQ